MVRNQLPTALPSEAERRYSLGHLITSPGHALRQARRGVLPPHKRRVECTALTHDLASQREGGQL